MKKLGLNKILLLCLSVLTFLFAGIFSVSYKGYDNNGINAVADDSVIENIYDETIGKFYFDNLNAIAQKVGYADVNAMIKAAEGGEIKNNSDFGFTTINFGKNAKDNSELLWLPAYLSNSDDGPVLTLWLRTDNINGLWGDGTYNNDEEVTPSSNNYSTSAIRVKTLNNGGTYYGEYEYGWVKQPTPFDYAPTSDGSNPFEMYTTGQLADYITTPSAVSWQATANHQKNDPLWDANSKGHYTPTEWLNDKLWLPSIYEMFDDEAKPLQDIFYSRGGFWDVTRNKIRSSNSGNIILRSVGPTDYLRVFAFINSSGNVSQCDTTYKLNEVRPALHLNLTKAVENAVYKHNHEFGEWQITTPATCLTDGEKIRVCSAENCTLENNTEKQTIQALGHEWATEFTIDTPSTCTTAGSKSKHCTRAGCDAKSETTPLPLADHSYTHYKSDGNATCTADGTKTAQCDNCTQKDTVTDVGSALGHEWVTEWSRDGTNHWHECVRSCGAKGEQSAHAFNWVVDKPATVTSTGLKHEECVCGERRNEDTVIEVLTCAHGDKRHVAAVAATCSSAGNVEYWVCNDCDRILDADNLELENTVIPADPSAHGWGDWQETTPATCLTDGEKTRVCTHDSLHTQTEKITALGHEFATEFTTDIPATCTAAGSKSKHCVRAGCQEKSQVTQIEPLGHKFENYVSDNNATFTQDGTETAHCSNGCGETDTRVDVGSMLLKNANSINGFKLDNVQYGDPVNPVATADYGSVVFTYSTQKDGEYSATKPNNVGTYYVKASVEESETYLGAEEVITFEITPRAIVVTVNSASSEQGEELEALTAAVTGGTVIEGDSPYRLFTDADKNVMGSYKISGECVDENYSITFVAGTYIVSKREEDVNGGGSIDLPEEIDVEFKVTQSKTAGDYSQLDGLKMGYWAQLWYRNGDGTLGDEFTDTMNCILTLKIPVEIIEAIRGGEEINRDKIARELSVYYVTDGALNKVEAFTVALKEDESWIIKFNYNAKFRAEVVFNAAGVQAEEQPAESAATPWWVWLILGLGGAALIGVVIIIIVVAKKKGGTVVVNGDDPETRRRLNRHDEMLEELLNRDDGGFSAHVDVDDDGNII